MLRRNVQTDVDGKPIQKNPEILISYNQGIEASEDPENEEKRRIILPKAYQGNKEVKKLGAKLISQKYKCGLIRGIITKEELLQPQTHIGDPKINPKAFSDNLPHSSIQNNQSTSTATLVHQTILSPPVSQSGLPSHSMPEEKLLTEDKNTTTMNQPQESLNHFHSTNFDSAFFINASSKEIERFNSQKKYKPTNSRSREDLTELSAHMQDNFDCFSASNSLISPSPNKNDSSRTQSPHINEIEPEIACLKDSENRASSQNNSRGTPHSFKMSDYAPIDSCTYLTLETGSHSSLYKPTVEESKIDLNKQNDDLNAILSSYAVATFPKIYDFTELQSKTQSTLDFNQNKENEGLFMCDDYNKLGLNANNQFTHNQESLSETESDMKTMPILSSIPLEYEVSIKSNNSGEFNRFQPPQEFEEKINSSFFILPTENCSSNDLLSESMSRFGRPCTSVESDIIRSPQVLDGNISKEAVYTASALILKSDTLFKKSIESLIPDEINISEVNPTCVCNNETDAPNIVTDYSPTNELEEDHIVDLIQEMTRCNINQDNPQIIDTCVRSSQDHPHYNENPASYQPQNEFFNLSMDTRAIPNPYVSNHLFHQYIPQQYYGQYYAQPYYSHPIDHPVYSTTYEPPRSNQNYLSHAPRNTYVDPYQAYSNNYTASAFVKWQEDYARWYKTYGESYQLQQSRRDSFLSSINQGRNDTCDTDGFSHFSNYGHKDTLEITSIRNETAYISDNTRNTPPMYPASHSFARFGPNNTLVCRTSSKLSVYSLDTSYLSEEHTFPGPLIKNDKINSRLLLQYISKCVKSKKNLEPSVKLLWKLMYEIIKGEGCCNVADLCDIIFSYNDKLNLSSFLSSPQPSVNEETHLKIVSSLLNHDLESVLSTAINSKNWALAFVLCFQNKNLQQQIIKKFVETLDSQDIIRSYISLQSNIPIDLSLMNIDETASNWNQHLALYLSQNYKNPIDCSNYIECISKILQSKSKWVESQICQIVLDLALNHPEVDPPIFYPKHSLNKHSLDLSPLDILHLRMMEMYEIVKLTKTPNFIFSYLQIYKYLYAEILSESFQREKAFEYVKSISQTILQDSITSNYCHGFLYKLLKLSKFLFHVLFYSVEYPDWILRLQEFVFNYSDPPQVEPLNQTTCSTIYPDDTQPTPISCSNLDKISSLPTLNLQNSTIKPEILVQKKPDISKIESEPIQLPSLIDDKSYISDQYNDPVSPISLIDVSSISSPVPPSIYIPPIPPEPHSMSLQKNVWEADSKPKPSETPYKSLSESQIPEKRSELKHDPFKNSVEPSKNTILSGAAKMIGKIFKSRDGVYLPDDTKQTIVFDKKVNRYVDSSIETNQDSTGPLLPPPPKSISSITTSCQSGPDLRLKQRPSIERYIAPKY